MSTIDEIMGVAEAYGECSRHKSERAQALRAAKFGQIRGMITAALADAKREGAEQMQQRIFPCCGGNDDSPAEHAMDCEHRRQAVRLSDEKARREIANAEWDAIMDHCYEFGTADEGQTYYRAKFARAIETAVLAANGLETK